MLKVGIIGVGVMGAGHARFIKEHVPKARVVALFDIDTQKIAALADELGTITIQTTDAETLMNHPDVDAVIIASPDPLHVAHLKLAIACKKPVLCEKPIATTLEDARSISQEIKAYEKTGDALYQPKSLKFRDPSILDGTGCMINIFGFGFARDKGIKDEGKYTEQEEISYASGTCMFAPKKIFDEIGYFDPTFFAYHEELDLGWRARIFGYRSYYVPQTIIHHHGSAHWKWSPQVFYLLERNFLSLI